MGGHLSGSTKANDDARRHDYPFPRHRYAAAFRAGSSGGHGGGIRSADPRVGPERRRTGEAERKPHGRTPAGDDRLNALGRPQTRPDRLSLRAAIIGGGCRKRPASTLMVRRPIRLLVRNAASALSTVSRLARTSSTGAAPSTWARM